MEKPAGAKRATIILFILMAIGIMLPFLLLWIRR